MFLSEEKKSYNSTICNQYLFTKKKQEVIHDLLDTTFSFTKFLKAVFIFKQD